MTQSWLAFEDFCKAAGLEPEVVNKMIEQGALVAKQTDEGCFIDAGQGTTAVVLHSPNAMQEIKNANMTQNLDFVEKTIGTILSLHEKVIVAKDETVLALRDENSFLKEALVTMQELYEEDRQTVSGLQRQLKDTQDELEFVKRKYKLMWNKAVENYGK